MNDKKVKLFEGIVGQESVKRKLMWMHDSYLSTRMVSNLLFVAKKGNGKTTIAREFAKGLLQFDEQGKEIILPETHAAKRKPFIEVNCASLRTLRQFLQGLISLQVANRDVTVLFDEASEIPRDIEMAMLTILNPNPEGITRYSHDEFNFEFDFRRQTFMFATSEVQSVFHALIDRLERIDLEEYSLEELGKIVKIGAPHVTFKEDVLEDMASTLRGNARAAQKLAFHILSYLKGKASFKRADWEKLCSILSIHPLGLNETELSALRYLATSPQGMSLTGLSAKTGMSRESLRQDVEIYLQKNGLMAIGTAGRIVTAKGMQYVKALDKKLAKA